MAAPRPTLHHLHDSQSMKILWLLEELGVDYELKVYQREISGPNKDRAPKSLQQIHPLGKSPTLVTTNGRVIIESGAIAKYLLQTYDAKRQFQGNADSGNDDIRDEMLTNFASASLSWLMLLEMMFEQVAKRSPFALRWLFNATRASVHSAYIGPELEKSWSFLEAELGQQDYFMGSSPGRADFMLSWPFDFCTQRKYVDLHKYPALERWYTRCHNREGWKRGFSKVGSYDLSF